MATVDSEIVIAEKPQRVFELAQQVERFPEVIASLKSVEVLSREGNRTRTRWVGTAQMGPVTRDISWEEEDEWDAEALECRFHLTGGDLKRYDGVWKFLAEDGGTRCLLHLDYEMGIPLLSPLVNKMIHAKMQESCDELLRGLKKLAAGV